MSINKNPDFINTGSGESCKDIDIKNRESSSKSKCKHGMANTWNRI